MTRRHESPTEHAVPGRFAGETVIVTGSTRGIGAGVAERFAAEGANVVVSGRTAEAGEAVARRISEWTTDETTDDPQTGDATFVRADMRDPDDVAALAEAAAERYGSVDVLVNNAGVQTETAADGDARRLGVRRRDGLPGILARCTGRPRTHGSRSDREHLLKPCLRHDACTFPV